MQLTDLSPQHVLMPADLERGPQRTPGVHLSTVLRRIAVKSGLLKIDDGKENGWGDPLMCMALGLAWEDWYAARPIFAVGGRLWYHPGETQCDGIIGTPDAVELDDDGCPTTVHEFKLTWKSAFQPIEREWLWWAQVKGYCVMLGLTRAVLHVCFVNGDYRDSGPLLRVWQAEFTALELVENWEMVRREAERMREEDAAR